jgi:hypothetical protein
MNPSEIENYVAFPLVSLYDIQGCKIWARRYELKCGGNWERMETWGTIGSDVASYRGNLVGTWWEHRKSKKQKKLKPHPQTKKLGPPQCILSPPQSSLSLLVLLGKEGNESLQLTLPVRTHHGVLVSAGSLWQCPSHLMNFATPSLPWNWDPLSALFIYIVHWLSLQTRLLLKIKLTPTMIALSMHGACVETLARSRTS